jgi:hypothetical protein
MAYGVSTPFKSEVECSPNNLVCVCRWHQYTEINLNAAFLTLPIVPVEEPISKKKKMKIPFYGVNDIIVSIRYKKEARGIRFVPKQPDNFVSIDLQTGNRNVHIKLSKQNALVMGVTSLEEGIAAVECLLDTIYMTDRNMEYLRKCKDSSIEDCLDFLEDYGKDLPDVEDYIEAIKKNNLPFTKKTEEKEHKNIELKKEDESKIGVPKSEDSKNTHEGKMEDLQSKRDEGKSESKVAKYIDERLAMILLVRAYEVKNIDKCDNIRNRSF